VSGEAIAAVGKDFAGRVAVVTGGSTGIGRAVVQRLAADGAAVVFCTHDRRTLPSEHEGISNLGPSVLGVVADVRSESDMRDLMALATRQFGGVDVLVCSAGIQLRGAAESTSLSDWRAVIDTNLTGAYLAAKFAIPQLRRRGGGAIVNLSSVQGQSPGPDLLAYSASKAGIEALTRSMAVDHARDHIRVNAVAPGPVDTPLLRTASSGADRSTGPRQIPAIAGDPLKRIARPAEIAEVVAFLASDRSSYVTGATYLTDGGMSVNKGTVLLLTGPPWDAVRRKMTATAAPSAADARNNDTGAPRSTSLRIE
jgi:NAD(P)-dependent dehydrogenase (short-subunit alcohol dehydrogenase family)